MRVVCLVLAILAVAPPAVACSCPPIPNLDESLVREGSRYQAVFEGVVTDKRVSIEDYYGLWAPLTRSKVTVERVWKGNHSRTILMYEGIGGCTVRYSAGARYLFVANRPGPVDDHLIASVCSPTNRVPSPARSQEITRLLGRPAAAFAAVEAAQLPDSATEFRFRLRVYLLSGIAAAHNLLTAPRTQMSVLGSIAWAIIGVFFGGLVAVAGLLVATVGSRQTLTGWLLFTAGALAAAPLVLAAAGYVYTEHTFLRQLVQWSWP